MAPRIDGFDVPEKIDTLQKTSTQGQTNQVEKEEKIDLPIRWRNVAIFVFLHMGALCGLYLSFYSKIQTLIFCMKKFCLEKNFLLNFYLSLFFVYLWSFGNHCRRASIVVTQDL